MNSHHPTTHFVVAVLVGLATMNVDLALTSPAAADQCGDRAGPGASRIACDCGDTVVTSTKLRKKDPVVNNVCPSTALFIQRENITLSCKRNTLTGEGAGSGIRLRGDGVLGDPRGAEIKNCRITGFAIGIDLGQFEVIKAFIHNNWLIDNSRGIWGRGFGYSVIRGNTFTNNGSAIRFVEACYENQIKNNKIKENAYGIWLDEADGITIIGNRIRNNYYGIFIIFGGGNMIYKNVITENTADGVYQAESIANVYLKNKLNDNGEDGLELDGGSQNLIEGNKASRNWGYGITQSDGWENTYRSNKGDRNGGTGLRVIGEDNVLKKNKFNRNGGDGICAVAGNIDEGGNRGRNSAGIDVSFTGPCTGNDDGVTEPALLTMEPALTSGTICRSGRETGDGSCPRLCMASLPR